MTILIKESSSYPYSIKNHYSQQHSTNDIRRKQAQKT